MNDWALHTCIKFEEKKDDDENYIYFVEKNGCVHLFSWIILFNLSNVAKYHNIWLISLSVYF